MTKDKFRKEILDNRENFSTWAPIHALFYHFLYKIDPILDVCYCLQVCFLGPLNVDLSALIASHILVLKYA